jgi:hypothetical protein
LVLASAPLIGAAIFMACAKGEELGANDVGDLVPIPEVDAGADGAPATGEREAGGKNDKDAAPKCVETGAQCATGNPGACATGVQKCDRGVSVCVPVTTTQPCYTGAASSKGVGACKAGTQSCIGSLGPCSGQVLPTQYENCFNDSDDDCNGALNNGCPDLLYLGPDRPLGGAGGKGGNPASVHCPPGAFVNRVDTWFDDGDRRASGVSIFCATPTLVRGSSSFFVTLAPSSPAPYATAAGDVDPANERTDDCGTIGLTAITYTVGQADDSIQGLGHHCGTSQLTLGPDNKLSIELKDNGDTAYNTWPTSTGQYFERRCAPNEVVVGFNLRKGNWLDNIEPICAPLAVRYK